MKTIEEKCAERREEKAAIAERKKAKRVGRPKKKKLPVGRPKGQEAIMKEYRMRMLNSPNSPYVLQKIMEAAMNDDHKHQKYIYCQVATFQTRGQFVRCPVVFLVLTNILSMDNCLDNIED